MSSSPHNTHQSKPAKGRHGAHQRPTALSLPPVAAALRRWGVHDSSITHQSLPAWPASPDGHHVPQQSKLRPSLCLCPSVCLAGCSEAAPQWAEASHGQGCDSRSSKAQGQQTPASGKRSQPVLPASGQEPPSSGPAPGPAHRNGAGVRPGLGLPQSPSQPRILAVTLLLGRLWKASNVKGNGQSGKRCQGEGRSPKLRLSEGGAVRLLGRHRSVTRTLGTSAGTEEPAAQLHRGHSRAPDALSCARSTT